MKRKTATFGAGRADPGPGSGLANGTALQIAEDAQLLSSQLSAMRSRLYPPASQKSLRTFTSGEVARLIGVSDAYLRKIALSGEGPAPAVDKSGWRSMRSGATWQHSMDQRPAVT
jgi:hypothetical protein